MLSYIGVVVLTFSGAPLVGHLAPPGVDELSRPAGDDGLGVGPGSHESPLPEAAADEMSGGGEVSQVGDEAPQPSEGSAPTSAGTSAAVTTSTATTTTAPGRSTNSTVPTPSSTVPEHTHATGGPPPEPPGKP